MAENFFDQVYKARNDAETRDLYDEWADQYDKVVLQEGYATPARCAQALRTAKSDLDAPILDFGCGTGLSGLALRLAGFNVIDGVDLSPSMLEVAREKGIYRNLTAIEAEEPIDGDYGAIAAIGVIGAGAAPLSALTRILDGLTPGMQFVFSFNDHTLEDPAFEDTVNRYISDGTMQHLFREHGDHLPGQDMKSTVYVLEKT